MAGWMQREAEQREDEAAEAHDWRDERIQMSDDLMESLTALRGLLSCIPSDIPTPPEYGVAARVLHKHRHLLGGKS